ncbi:MAG: UDP-2,3-diacylglucosamine diphosphatase [Flavobacteriales bacterium]
MKNKVYFASDFHLGAPNFEESLIREKKVVQWLEEVRKDASEIFLVGDVFDFWFEYKRAVPRGFTRLLGKISEITDSGIPVHWFIGNHDMWIFDYLPQECGITLHRAPIVREWNGKKYFIGHGDGLGPGDNGYKILKKFFASSFCQWLFARLHPNFGIWLAQKSSGYSRSISGESDKKFLGEENEWLAVFSNEQLQKEHFDYFIFGHRHLPMQIKVGENSEYINIGDWLHHYTYGVMEDGIFELKKLNA